MKILTVNFLTCAVKTCKTSALAYPLHFRDAELEQAELDFNPTFIQNILPRVDWEALRITARELGFTTLPDTKPERGGEGADVTGEVGGGGGGGGGGEKVLRGLHTLLLETQVTEGKLVCGNCGHEYAIKEGIANFLLPSHLV